MPPCMSAMPPGTGLGTPEQVTAVRKAVKRGQPWTMAELMPTIPTPLANAAEWKVTASHNESAAGNLAAAAPAAPRATAAPQAPGMWFQVELPAPTRISELVIESALPFSFGRGGRGGAGGGRGAVAAGDAA